MGLPCIRSTGNNIADASLNGGNRFAPREVLRQHSPVRWRFASGTCGKLAAAVVALLIAIEVVRRIGLFASCYVELRYDLSAPAKKSTNVPAKLELFPIVYNCRYRASRNASLVLQETGSRKEAGLVYKPNAQPSFSTDFWPEMWPTFSSESTVRSAFCGCQSERSDRARMLRPAHHLSGWPLTCAPVAGRDLLRSMPARRNVSPVAPSNANSVLARSGSTRPR